MRRHRGLLKTKVWALVEDRAGGREGERLGGRLQAKESCGDGARTGGGGRGADGKGGDVKGACREYKLDDKMMSKAVLVRRELGKGCVVMT